MSKVAISLEDALFHEAEQLRARTGESRSALIARALKVLLKTEQREAEIAQYVAAYKAFPESDDEIDAAREFSRRALAFVEWE